MRRHAAILVMLCGLLAGCGGGGGGQSGADAPASASRDVSSSSSGSVVSLLPPSQLPFTPHSYETRGDGAVRVTNSAGSAQNATLTSDGTSLLYTRFLQGYNAGPSEIVRLNVLTGAETIVIPNRGADHVMSPSGGWVNNAITYSSDEGTAVNEVFTANVDGTAVKQVTNAYQSSNSIEPVYNPGNLQEIAFEVAPTSATQPHHLAMLQLDQGGAVTDLTADPAFDDRLPAFSPDGSRLAFQRSPAGQGLFRVFVGTVNRVPAPHLTGVQAISPAGFDFSDNTWSPNGVLVITSSNFGGIPTANIMTVRVDGTGTPQRLTQAATLADEGPSVSSDGRSLAFESHASDTTPSQIWMRGVNLGAAPP